MRHKAVVGATILLRMQRSAHSAICGEHRQVFLEQSTDYHHDKRVIADIAGVCHGTARNELGGVLQGPINEK